MGYKIARGAFFGIFIGVIFGVAVSGGMYLNGLIGSRTETIQSAENDAIQVFNTDYSETQMYDSWGNTLTPDVNVSLAGDNDAQIDFDSNTPECEDLQDVILRFHVRANSDRQVDIDLKHTVRDAILTELGNELKGNMSREEVLEYIGDNLDYVEQIALDTIREAGYGYTVKVYISNDYFPIRQYGEMVLPAGIYQALRVDIGLAHGENFWCILYPMMCYTVDSGAVVSKEDEELLADKLTEEQYEKLFVERDVEDNEVKARFKLLEWLGL